MMVKRTVGTDPDFQQLVAKLDLVLAEVNGEADACYRPHNTSVTLTEAVIALSEGAPVGIGAFRELEPGTVEIKRMFVCDSMRGKGIGYVVLKELESWAKELGFHTAKLETHVNLKPAILLYQKAGYAVIPNYSQYCGIETSVCMSKSL
jgi:putative acetyltransferase